MRTGGVMPLSASLRDRRAGGRLDLTGDLGLSAPDSPQRNAQARETDQSKQRRRDVVGGVIEDRDDERRSRGVPLGEGGHVLRAVSEFVVGEPFDLRVADGRVRCDVLAASEEPKA